MTIPQNISYTHIIRAIRRVDREGIPERRHSSTYDAVHSGKKYPPKLLVSWANVYANGVELEEFEGGEDTECFQLLADLGFALERKSKRFQHDIDFFTQSEFDALRRRAGEKRVPGDKAQDTDWQLLKESYEKTAYWMKRVKSSIFPGGRSQIRRDPTNQAGNFESYNWGKIYPCSNAKEIGKLAYTVSIEVDVGFVAKIDTVGESGAKRSRYEAYRNESSSPIRLVIPIEEGLSLGWDELIDRTTRFFGSLERDYRSIDQLLDYGIYPRNGDDRTMEPTSDANGDLPLNQILYGPPGTGKTYRTVDLALQIIAPEFLKEHATDRAALKQRFDELKTSGQIEFVTFHQSFTYEDFVEGLRAYSTEDGISYEVADGVFKSLCGRSAPDSAGDSLTHELSTGDSIGGYVVEGVTGELLQLRKPNGSLLPLDWRMIDELTAAVTREDITVSDIREKRVFDKLDTDLEKYIVHGYNNVLAPIVERLSAASVSSQELPPVDTKARNPYVLIIDEINRGNISSIFGELITLIEASKRAGSAEALEVTLPYSKSRFSVPDNVYIIGTMNTADRSLAAVDIALRRRFRFTEMMPDMEVLDGIAVDGVAIRRMVETINDRIEILYDREHALGHAFFLPLRSSPSIETLSLIFESEILPLLEEYFFEDWNRISMVLADDTKRNPSHRFFVPRFSEARVDELLNGTLDETPEIGLRRNLSALKNVEAYRGIYELAE